jgi:hypothetical protein
MINNKKEAEGCFNGLCIWCVLFNMIIESFPNQKEELINHYFKDLGT